MEECFEQFLRQKDKCVFAIVGESGVGKTNTICHLAEIVSNEPTVFLSGSILGISILKELVADFNLVFSPQESEISVLKKISALAETHRKTFIIFFDAIDEWIAENKVYQINQLIKYIKHLNIKICISCKDLIWNSFITQSGIQTDLSDNLYPN
jgi:ABC-type dipeptide/oligopeptide/nickel transport system ATPase component